MEQKERKINREHMEWWLGNGGLGKGWSPGFCSGPNRSCIKIFRALNTKNIIAIPYKISNKNLLSHKISARKYNKVLFLFFYNDYFSSYFESRTSKWRVWGWGWKVGNQVCRLEWVRTPGRRHGHTKEKPSVGTRGDTDV